MTALLDVSGLTLSFGGLQVLDDVSFDVDHGELLALIGPNGAGKTSTFNCVNGVYQPDSGSIRLNGEDLVGIRPVRLASLGVARTFQNLALFSNLDVIDNLMLGRHQLMRTGFAEGALWLGGARREEAVHRARCMELVDLLGLGDALGRPVAMLPYGVQKRIEFGRAVAMAPRLLLLDEPVAGMNSDETAEMARYILHVRHELDLTMVMIEHDMHLVMDLADRIVCLSFGEVIAAGSPDEIAVDPAVIAAYLGSAEALS